MVFLTFLKFSLKFREQIHCREAASNALIRHMCRVVFERQKFGPFSLFNFFFNFFFLIYFFLSIIYIYIHTHTHV
jgi:hypothetical protein